MGYAVEVGSTSLRSMRNTIISRKNHQTMPPNQRSRSLLQRHRGKLLISLTGIAALFTTGSVVVFFVKRWLYKQQLRITEQHFIKEQIKRRFEQTQEDSLYTIYELLPVWEMVLNESNLDLDSIITQLKDQKNHTTREKSVKSIESSPLKTKAELWNELELKSLIKLTTVTYTVSSLILLTRLQLNILTRNEYLDSAIKLTMEQENSNKLNSRLYNWVTSWWSNPEEKMSDATAAKDTKMDGQEVYINEQAFLSLSWWILNKGWLHYNEIITNQIEIEFSGVNPRDTLTLEEFSSRLTKIFQNINSQIFQENNDSLLSIFLPKTSSEQEFLLSQTLDPEALESFHTNTLIFKQLINELTQCIESTVTSIVLESLINESFHFIMNKVGAKTMAKKKPGQEDQQYYQMAVFTMSIKDCCQEMLQTAPGSAHGGGVNEYLATLDSVQPLDDLSASVYSNFGVSSSYGFKR
ncbi:PEX3-like protein [Saccharomyces kudriavzevii IFO 1802]|uniref:Peroxin-3 n=2 Tax=Saccharomyces kudriavzevii (strain ATCC MYA-4449 / AS 2.2408 / CBS 8840 / NBRC 1802 / NCYC 2889) TaxID=226230 RepID=J6EPL8_SACK1|nr:PEX3-like protein [Saccharomyces kudriavzevii IFO 1802]